MVEARGKEPVEGQVEPVFQQEGRLTKEGLAGRKGLILLGAARLGDKQLGRQAAQEIVILFHWDVEPEVEAVRLIPVLVTEVTEVTAGFQAAAEAEVVPLCPGLVGLEELVVEERL